MSGLEIHDYSSNHRLIEIDNGNRMQIVPIPKDVDILTIAGADGKTILRIDHKGDVHGDVRDATEAGRLFADGLAERIKTWGL